MDEPEPRVRPMTREEFDQHTYLKFKDTTDEEKKAKEKRKTRAAWLFCVPVGFIAAFLVTVMTNMGTAGFFFAWLAFSVAIYSLAVKS